MWRNHLVLTLRLLARNKLYAFVNLFGLALGLAACLLILIYVRYESSYDSTLPDAERVFQLQNWFIGSESGPGSANRMTSFASGTALRKDFPEIETLVYVGNNQPVIVQNGEASISKNFYFTDGALFDVLQFPFLHGDRRSSLSEPGQAVLTESEARRRFGTSNAVGRTLTLMIAGEPVDYRISGVIADPPRNSHIQLSIVARYDPQNFWAGTNFLTDWLPKNGWVYLKLKPGADVERIRARMPAWEKRNIKDELVGGQRSNVGETNDWKLVNVRDIHLGEAQSAAGKAGNDPRAIATMGLVGILILFMAIVNFTNLATARAGQRAREVALRKVVGASRRQLIAQFLAESILLAAAAMVVGLAMAEAALPSLNAFLESDMRLTYGGKDGLLLPAVLLVLLVGGVAGFYPAFYLSRFQPASVLKANRSTAEPGGSGRLRNMLVLVQFAVAIGLIACTAIIHAQTEYARTTDPGYRRDGLIQIGNMYRRAILPVSDSLIREIRAIDGVTAAGRSTIGIATFGMENMNLTAPGAAESVELELHRVDPNFFETMGIDLIAGRGFAESRALDDSTVDGFSETPEADAASLARRGYSVVLNAAAARRLGYADPRLAVGKVLKADDGDVDANGQTPVTVIGVVGDSRFRTIREPISPTMFSWDRQAPGWLLVRYSGSPHRIRAQIQKAWKRIAPDVPFEAEYGEDIIGRLYSAESARAWIFTGFATLAVLIGCLGLFGLAAFSAERRTREIGIRKVLGARTRDIVRLLLWQFSRPVLLANLIAWPVAWWAMRDWLNGFDTRIDLTPLPFLGAGAVALVIAAATMSGHAVKAARTRPVHALRYE